MAVSNSLIQTGSNFSGKRTALILRLRYLVLPGMVSLFALYVVLHTPLRDGLALAFGFKSRGCFFCLDGVSIGSLANSLGGMVLIAAALMAAWIVGGYFGGATYERWLTLGLGAVAFIAMPAAALGALGDWIGAGLLCSPFGPWLTVIPSVIVVALQLRHGLRFRIQYHLWSRPSGLVIFVGGLGVASLLASAFVSVTHPPSGIDALGYHAPLAVFLWSDGNLGAFLDRAPGDWALAQPGTAESWFGLLRLVGGESLANLGQLPFALLGSAAVYAFARRMRLAQGAALVAGEAFLLVPMVIVQSGMQPNDVIGSALLMTVVALASTPVVTWTRQHWAWLGLGMGLVATTKLALLPGVAGVGMFVLGVAAWQARQNGERRRILISLLVLGLAFLLVVSPWWLRNIVRFGNPLYPAALPLIGRGIFDASKADAAFVPTPRAWFLYPLLENHDEQSGIGALFAVAVLPGLALAAWRSRRQPLLLFLVVAVVTLPAWWVLTQHFPRFLLALAGLGLAFVPWSLLAAPRAQRRIAAMLLAGAAIFSMLVTFDQALLPFARQPLDRAEFYDRAWGIDPAVLALSEKEGILYNTGYAPTISQYAGFYPLLGADQSRLVIPLDNDPSTESIVARMERSNLHYAYVAASPDNRSLVETLYDPMRFEIVHLSTIVAGDITGGRRNLYRMALGDEEKNGTRRYLYRLK